MKEREYKDSIWKQTTAIPHRPALAGDMQADVAVIGAGIAGILTAYELQKRGKKVIVLEADRIGSGQTGNTTAKITGQHGLIYDSLIRLYGEEFARRYAKAQEQAISDYEHLVKAEKISCHWERKDSYLYTVSGDERLLRRELAAAKTLGIAAEYRLETPLPFPVKGAVCFPEQAQFHPLEFLGQLAKKLTVYEKTEVLRVRGRRVETNRGTVRARRIVFACHYPFPIVPGWYFLRQHQERSYVLALSGIPRFEGMYYGIDSDGLSYRWYEDLLLVGGGGHRTGEVAETCGFRALESQVRERFPCAKTVARWSAQDCMPHDKLPFVGRFSLWRPDWYVVTGLKKWGMTGAMVAAKLLAAQVSGQHGAYASLFTPQRVHWRASQKALWNDVKHSVKGLGKGYLGRKTPRCPHMGCALVWNADEKTWECPCHGSRFSSQGELLDGPAQNSLQNVKSL